MTLRTRCRDILGLAAVEDEARRIFQDDAGDREALAARQFEAALVGGLRVLVPVDEVRGL
ncbi:hypothetical protein [Haloarchaeobius sp. FL176]|uniref:hypothetical protein n=1 Tax=Haloarchaeobius sp. FL176 TaxID=2967129 RepID=UPI0021495346|nr:hypothetical protein [Haloarchaeobius sp. FL176]